jgi:lipopolysaccharide assembly outer membrane protein LptD (OstA)
MLFILAPYLMLCTPSAHPDAYLSEDEVYYGADSYKVDYNKEVIQASGHAFFRKANRLVFADRIMIEYAKGVKRAVFHDRVLMQNKDERYRISGDSAEARFDLETYTVEGNSAYTDDARTIRSHTIRKDGGEELRFSGDVRYVDGTFNVNAPGLTILRETASFGRGVEVLDRERGDRILCDRLTYYTLSGDVLFEGNVYYLQGTEKGGEGSGKPAVLQADAVRYVRDIDTLLLAGKAYLLRGDFSLGASTVEYDRRNGRVTARGDAVLRDGSTTVYSTGMEFDVDSRVVIMHEEARGVFSSRRK